MKLSHSLIATALSAALLVSPAQACLQLSDVRLGMTRAEVEEILNVELNVELNSENRQLVRVQDIINRPVGIRGGSRVSWKEYAIDDERGRLAQQIAKILDDDELSEFPEQAEIALNHQRFMETKVIEMVLQFSGEDDFDATLAENAANGEKTVAGIAFTTTGRLQLLSIAYHLEGTFDRTRIEEAIIAQNPGSESVENFGVSCGEGHDSQFVMSETFSDQKGDVVILFLATYGAPPLRRYFEESRFLILHMPGASPSEGSIVHEYRGIFQAAFDSAHADTPDLIARLRERQDDAKATMPRF